ncbi:MAG: sugar kinase [Firmicutes bacterium]|nr:sugar kinase [Bacillota bacterium]
MFDLVTFGETLVRLSPPGPETIEQASYLNIYPAGSELNVAVTAKRLGLRVSYVSKVAANPLGRYIVNRCREHGVDVANVKYSDTNRQGLYFFENGASPRPGVAYYDRADSAFANVCLDDFDWPSIVSRTRIFLASGINPALSPGAHAVTLEAVKAARSAGKLVAFDLNYRSKLWGTKTASNVLREYLPYVSILFTSGGDAADILGFEEPPGEELALHMSKELKIPTVCLVYGPVRDSKALWRCICASDGKAYAAEQQGVLYTVDRLGAGDAFAGGFLAGFLEEGPDLGVQMGNATMTLKNTYKGDIGWMTRDLVDAFVAGESGMIRR